MKNNIIVLSLGGSLIVPKSGFNYKFLSEFKKMILDFTKDGTKFIIVCGGGNTARIYQDVARKVGELTPNDIDWIGIHATRLNAHFMRTIFREQAHSVVVKNPTRKLKWKENILIAAGWKPGWSTDYDAVKLAELYDAGTVINLSNIEYVYDSDPNINKKAKKLENISWENFRKIVGNKWVPGANLPFDPIASRTAHKNNLKVVVMDGGNFKEVRKAILGQKCRGTVIK